MRNESFLFLGTWSLKELRQLAVFVVGRRRSKPVTAGRVSQFTKLPSSFRVPGNTAATMRATKCCYPPPCTIIAPRYEHDTHGSSSPTARDYHGHQSKSATTTPPLRFLGTQAIAGCVFHRLAGIQSFVEPDCLRAQTGTIAPIEIHSRYYCCTYTLPPLPLVDPSISAFLVVHQRSELDS
jgi:hypothetical protein